MTIKQLCEICRREYEVEEDKSDEKRRCPACENDLKTEDIL